jgi:hypothetical protein
VARSQDGQLVGRPGRGGGGGGGQDGQDQRPGARSQEPGQRPGRGKDGQEPGARSQDAAVARTASGGQE